MIRCQRRHPLLSLALSLLMGSSILGRAAAADAPASQPSQKSGARVQCNEWIKDAGREGECQVGTDAAMWKIKYYKEGPEKRSLKNFVRNLLILFPPDGSTHKVHEWWDLVGKGKAIDTNRWAVLSLGYPSGDNSKISISLFLTAEEILKVELAVIDYLYPKRKAAVVGGASRGGEAAFLLSQLTPIELDGLFMFWFQGTDMGPDIRDTENIVGKLDEAEAGAGPYDYWPADRKYEWWEKATGADITERQYTQEYFRDPKWLVDVNLKPEQYRGVEQFKADTVKTWIEYFRDNEHPRPFYQRAYVLDRRVGEITKTDLKKLPKRILLLGNKLDQIVQPPKLRKFEEQLTGAGKKVTSGMVEDIRGHIACCVTNMSPTAAGLLGRWLVDL